MEQYDEISPRKGIPIDETDDDLCRALWIAVAIQAMIDAGSRSCKKSVMREKSFALQWLFDSSGVHSDFAWVCDLAGIDFIEVRKKFRSSLGNPLEPIDFRCLKKAGIGDRATESRKRYFARARKNARLRQERASSDAVDQPDSTAPYCGGDADPVRES